MTKKFTVKDMVLCALLAAMTGILSQIGIPIGEIPINLALFSVYLAGGLLGSYKGAVSMVVYVMMGAVGMPVFSNYRGGLSVLAGPTGGYILGYIFAALAVGMVSTYWGDSVWKLAVGMTGGLALCYLFGTVWFVLLTGKGLVAALSACVVPFLPGDAVKIISAAILVPELKKAINLSRKLA
ncbi:MAG TPA: biotin transporter BioY [Ruminococcaceae bacterium]|nr:biotin transporter BioY [Oscillospiraceae bacterium]